MLGQIWEGAEVPLYSTIKLFLLPGDVAQYCEDQDSSLGAPDMNILFYQLAEAILLEY